MLAKKKQRAQITQREVGMQHFSQIVELNTHIQPESGLENKSNLVRMNKVLDYNKLNHVHTQNADMNPFASAYRSGLDVCECVWAH